MPINPGIIAGLNNKPFEFANPLDNYSKAQSLRKMMVEGQMLDQQQADDQATRQVYRDAQNDPNKIYQGLVAAGLHKQADAHAKSMLDQQAKNATMRKDLATAKTTEDKLSQEQYVRAMNDIGSLTDVASASASIDDAVKKGSLPPEKAMQLKSGLPEDGNPLAFKQWQKNLIFNLQNAHDKLKYTEPDANAQLNAQTLMRGQDMGQGTYTVLQTPTGAFAMPTKVVPGQAPKLTALTDPATGNQVVKPNSADDKKNMAGYQMGLKELSRDEANIKSVSDLENAYKRWQELNGKVETGPITGRRPISFDSDYQELKQLENYLTMNNFKAGQGAISNTERQFMKGSGPNTLNNKETNDNITRVGLGAVQNLRDRANFKEDYLEKNGKLLGSEIKWQKYLDENPRFIVGKDGKLTENTKRVGWEEYFNGNQAPAEQPSATPDLAALARAELERRKKK